MKPEDEPNTILARTRREVVDTYASAFFTVIGLVVTLAFDLLTQFFLELQKHQQHIQINADCYHLIFCSDKMAPKVDFWPQSFSG